MRQTGSNLHANSDSGLRYVIYSSLDVFMFCYICFGALCFVSILVLMYFCVYLLSTCVVFVFKMMCCVYLIILCWIALCDLFMLYVYFVFTWVVFVSIMM